MKVDKLIPYGSPAEELKIIDDGVYPLDWSGTKEEWAEFFEEFVVDVRTHIWPEWDAQAGEWVGTATEFAQEATRLENAMCIEHIQEAGVLEQLPTIQSYSGPVEPKTHLWHYRIEDYIGAFFTSSNEDEVEVARYPVGNLSLYADGITPTQSQDNFGRMYDHKYNGIFQTKLRFRRPRPQQAAFALGQTSFKHRQAQSNVHTGNHPALISGHCAQGLLMICFLIDEKLSAGTAPEDMPLRDYGQYAVDFGDRRVFAGVHYPTDNFSSWIAVLRLIPRVFKENAPFLERFIRTALREQSLVYELASKTFPEHEELRHSWRFLQQTF